MEHAHQRLGALIQKACGRREPALDSGLLAQLKAICRLSDDNVLAAWEALWTQLRAPHAQSRLLALRVCEQLFKRSRTFRHALLARLAQFMEAVLGLRAERPLPPPAQAAASLREEALDLLQAWSQEHGARHKQLPLAVRYLRDTLQYRFPEGGGARAAAAEAEARAQQERQQVQLRQRLAGLMDGEWREGAGVARQLLLELDECFTLLDEQQAQQGLGGQQGQPQGQAQAQRMQQQGGPPAASSGGAEVGAAGEVAVAGEELEWEDVAAADAAAPQLQQQGQQQQHEGLAAYAGLEEEDGPAAAEAAAAAAAAETGAAAGDAGRDIVLLETLAGLYRQLTNRTLPQVQEWLSVLGRVEPEGPQQEAQRQQLLRSTTELRGRLAAAKERCDAEALDLEALLLQRQRREQQAAAAAAAAAEAGSRQRQQSAAVAGAMRNVFGDSDSEGESQEARQQQRRGGAAQRQGQQRRRRRQSGTAEADAEAGEREGEEESFENPYLRIVDPTLPRPRSQQAGTAAAQPQAQQQQQQQLRAPARSTSSSLPEELRKKLAAQAPELPSGLHTMFWDSKSVPTYVSGHGMELSNHWGRVDVHQELPPERVDELFLLPMPSRQKQQHTASGAGPGATSVQQQQRGPAAAGASRDTPEQLRNGRAGSAGGSAQQQQQQHQHQQQQQEQQPQQQPQQQSQPQISWPSRLQGAAGPGPSSAPGARAGREPDSRAAKRARRAEERAYNEAIIGGALSDELLARQLQDAEQQQQEPGQAQDGEAAGDGGGRRGRQAKKMTIRDRLAQKLLRGSAVAAALRDVTAEEGEMRRERAANRW